MVFTLILFFLLGASLPLTNGIPMRCTQISSTMVYFNNITGSATLSVYKKDNVQYVSIKDVNVVNYIVNSTANRICIVNGACTYNLTAPFESKIGNTTFEMFAFIPGSSGVYFFDGIVDDQSFFSFDGMYSLDNLCSTKLSDQSHIISKEVHCCMAFEAAPQASANSPRCTKFQSKSSILNTNDSSVFATSTMNFYLNGNNISADGNFTGPKGYNYSVDYSLNDKWMCNGEIGSPTVSCHGVTLPKGDSKTLLSVDYVKWNGSIGDVYSGGTLGRILIRDGQTLMEEGIPFTPKNDCFYQTVPYGGSSNQVVNHQFCCTEFENSCLLKQPPIAVNSLSHPPVLPPGYTKHSQFGRIP